MGSLDSDQAPRIQVPVAVVGMACRLPGHSNSPTAFWDFLLRHGIASTDTPASRFRLAGHYDGRGRLRTMKSPGGMFMEDVDPALFDGQFFRLNQTDCIGMDPQQRQLLEVAYECLENAGTTLEGISQTNTGCIVGSSSLDYHDIQTHDPEDRPDSAAIGIASCIHSNRISHFLNIHGPSFTVDTACSSSLVAVDVACRYLDAAQADGMLVGGVNLWFSPEHNQETGMLRAAQSATARCHSFDAKADGYVKAEGVSVIYLKRLADAIRDGDPIRAVIRGTATNSDGHTPAGIASPSAEAQAAAIQRAYANAGITDFNGTGFLECHGTGTPTGDPIEVRGAAIVFAPSRTPGRELVIGSVKSNIGHSEAAAGLSGLIKAVLAVESGVIPGNPTFVDPNPSIDFHALRVRATRTTIKWPKSAGDSTVVRRASVSSYGFGGANAHAVVESVGMLGSSSRGVSSYKRVTADTFFDQLENEDDDDERRDAGPLSVLFFSANDEESLRKYVSQLSAHFIKPGVSVDLRDLAYTLSARRTRHYVGAFSLCRDTRSIREDSLVIGRLASPHPPRVGFVFTGQGAQWSQMGAHLIEYFPMARAVIRHLDGVLSALEDPPTWSLLDELTEPRSSEVLRQPEFSQPLVTALQLALLAVTEHWGIQPVAVVGHSSGEIAAAACAGLISYEDAIKVAYYRGLAAKLAMPAQEPLGMLAVGISAEKIKSYINDNTSSPSAVQVACFNGPNSLTLSGPRHALDDVRDRLQDDGHFARMLHVDLAYHSSYMTDIAETYHGMLSKHCELKGRNTQKAPSRPVQMFSSVTGDKILLDFDRTLDVAYWKANMVSTVLFDQAVSNMLQDVHNGASFLVEIGPSDTLSGPISQIANSLTGSENASPLATYTAAWKRSTDPMLSLYNTAGHLFLNGGRDAVDLTKVNRLSSDELAAPPRVVTDLPNYAWNHTTRYWHETQASRDWRFKPFIRHDLLGSKINGTPWAAPTFRHTLRLSEQPWLRDHKLFRQIVIPGAAYITMTVEAVYQATMATVWNHTPPARAQVRMRNVHFTRAMMLEYDGETRYTLSLTPARSILASATQVWYEFAIRDADAAETAAVGVPPYCSGLVCIEGGGDGNNQTLPRVVHGSPAETAPLNLPEPASVWFRAMAAAGYNFGPNFRKILMVEANIGSRTARTTISLVPPPSEYLQSDYALHPAVIDAALQTCIPPLSQCDVAAAGASRVVLIPQVISSLVIPIRRDISQKQVNRLPDEGICVSSAKWIGVGDVNNPRNYTVSCSLYDPHDSELLFEMQTMTLGAIEASEVRTPHTIMREIWDADISLLLNVPGMGEQDKGARLRGYLDRQDDHARDGENRAKLQRLLDLVAHKNPGLKVLECNLYPGNASSVWTQYNSLAQAQPSPIRWACRRHQLAVCDTDTLVRVQKDHIPSVPPGIQVALLDAVFNQEVEGGFDLVIVNNISDVAKAAELQVTPDETTQHIMVAKGIRKCLRKGGLVVATRLPTSLYHFDDLEMVDVGDGISVAQLLDPGDRIEESDSNENGATTYNKRPAISLVSFLPSPSETSLNISSKLASQYGWEISTFTNPEGEEAFAASTPVLVLDEISETIMDRLDEKQWLLLQHLVAQERRILWVTSGAQLHVSHPTRAAILGLFRTVRAEEGLRLISLDVESAEDHYAISKCLDLLCQEASQKDSEFVSRSVSFPDDNGTILYISRIVPDAPPTALQQDDDDGNAPVIETSLNSHPVTLQLGAGQLGSIDSLRWAEVSPNEEAAPLPYGWIEIEVVAAGLNYKDVLLTMGIVPGNDHAIGGDSAGVVRRVGAGVDEGVLAVGDRVVALCDKCFANRVRVSAARAHRIPEEMTFAEAAGLLSAYLTAVHALLHLAGLKKGMSVLIHSAAGGLGIAALQLARYVGAEIYATASTPEKKEFLKSTFGLPEDHVFHSRDAGFADDILRVTNKRGVDVVLNSLTGDMLDASLRVVAEGGVMVDVGKKDILDQKYLPMEPFDRNVSFHAVDMAPQRISEELVTRCIKDLFDLIRAAHVSPIKPLRIFPWTDVIPALRILGSGKHIGKMVLSSEDADTDVKVQVRMAPKPLCFRADSCFLLVGGLRGVCGALAVYMAKCGAKYLAVLSRSGHGDEKSTRIVKRIEALGAHIDLLIADVTVPEEVERALQQTTVPVAGIIQGAMVLRDRPFSSMTFNEYRQALDCKIKGTWNLQNAADKLGLALDFFILLSSSSGVIGARGQANYAAGNAFQDAFAAYRRQRGQPACAIDLGVVEDVGVVAEGEGFYEKHLDARILRGIGPDLLQKLLRVSILQQQQQQQKQQKGQYRGPHHRSATAQMITGFVFPQPPDSTLVRDPRFAALFRTERAETNSAASGGSGDDEADLQALRELLRLGITATEQAQLTAMTEVLTRQLGRMLGLTSAMDPDRPLATYGVDSLAAMEVRNWVRRGLGELLGAGGITTLDIIGAGTLKAFAVKILDKIHRGNDASG